MQISRLSRSNYDLSEEYVLHGKLHEINVVRDVNSEFLRITSPVSCTTGELTGMSNRIVHGITGSWILDVQDARI